MSTLKMLGRSLGLAAALSVVGLVAGAAAASAVVGTFSSTGQVRLSGDLTVSLDGGSPVQCSGFEAVGRIPTSMTFVLIQGGTTPPQTSPSGNCAGGTELGLAVIGGVNGSNGSGWTLSNSLVNGYAQASPFGIYRAYGFTGAWINAVGGDPSRVVLNDSFLGYRTGDNAVVSASGTLEVTTLAGGDVTVAE